MPGDDLMGNSSIIQTDAQSGELAAPLLEEGKVDDNHVVVRGSKYMEYFNAFPGSIKYLVWNEFCERFSFYGMKTILALYLLEHLRLSENESTELVHLFIVACYATPLLGAFLSDCKWGKYRTILYLSIVYCIGNWVMALAAAPKPSPSTKSTLFWSTALALALIALGTGGIKPCVSAFGGDQIQFTLPDSPAKDRLHRQFFSMYYFAVNAGSLISTLLTPVLRTDVSYSVAFAVPAALMMCALLIFWSGRRSYVDRPPEGNVFGEVGAVVVDAIRLRGRAGQGSHWLDSSKLKHNPTVVEDVKALFRVLILLLPTPLFWSLFDQQSSKWVFQASKLDGHVPWLFNVVIEPDQMQALNPVLILAMIPLFDQIIYPFLEKHQVPLRPVPRMVAGMVLSALAFLLSGLLQIAMDQAGATTLSMLWQIPQIMAITAGEILFSITGLEFAYSQAPDSMKSVVQAAWLFTVAAGNLVTVILVAIIGDHLSKANEFFFFAVGCVFAMLLLLWGGSHFVYKQDISENQSEYLVEALIEDRVHSV
jgi:dipeptide/tripeptide permease